jgi:ATP-dependent helicase/nuclease subunit A
MGEAIRIPPKPAGSRWTDEQWAAVNAGGSRLLVSAAAGSGKTAVLVERIISRIADESHPLDVDAMLVATFTKAAAAEMKARIRSALEELLERRPDSRHLRRQLALLPRASITTLHAFCLDIVRQYAPLAGVDPDFRVIGEIEAELMKSDVLDDLLEERYGAEGPDGPLARLAERYGGERGDELLHRLVLRLYDFSRSQPWPEHWLKECARRFAEAEAGRLASSPWAEDMKREALIALEGACAMLQAARDLALRPGGPAPYADTLAEDLAVAERLRAAVAGEPWERWKEAFANVSFGRLKPVRGGDTDPLLQERVKKLRDDARKSVSALAEEWMSRGPDEYAAELQELAPYMETLAELVIAFGERFAQAKRDRGVLDFSDLEHTALRLLRAPESTPERPVPSEVALAYRERFEEILLDEYQDTNEVQEALVELISRRDPGNVFMVGDVKQSIYRFRLAEPGLFLQKYKTFRVLRPGSAVEGDEAPPAGQPAADGVRIDLSRNFRSRRNVVEAVNRVFRLIMRETVGELDYGPAEELVCGGLYPEEGDESGAGHAEVSLREHPVELIVIDRGDNGARAAAEDGGDSSSGRDRAAEAAPREADRTGIGTPSSSDGEEPLEDPEDLEAIQLEARCIAAEIRRLVGGEGGLPGAAVYDGAARVHRPAAYRDIAILLRATANLAPVVLEELKAAGIPAFADLATGYFAASEVHTMISLLQIIDNPDQDIPLAGVLRSPIVGLSAEELARIRLADRRGSFWKAVRAAATDEGVDGELRRRLDEFLRRLDEWRTYARREPIGDLLLKLYRDTEYENFVGGLPGGAQRQANLRALADRARQFERSGSRGLYRFLRFLERMRETGADLGAARVVGEQENAVRIMSIHKSKGLEFPVVFVAGLGRSFNRQDLGGLFLYHKRLGFGPKLVDPELRTAHPTLPYLAIRRRLAAELIAEEMRVLYVALTRAKERLTLVAASREAAQELARWREALERDGGRLPDAVLAAATRYLDWLGPAFLAAEGEPESSGSMRLRTVPAAAFAAPLPGKDEARPETEALWRAVRRLEPAPVAESEAGKRAYEALSWTYPHAAATRLAAKTSVTAMKKMREEAAEEARAFPEEESAEFVPEGSFRLRRPRFLAAGRLTPAERGTAYHVAFQHLPLGEPMDGEDLERWLRTLPDARLLSGEQARAVDPNKIAAFCQSELYARMRSARRLWREMPFSFSLPAEKVYADMPEAREAAGEAVLVQGVIDCLFEEEDGLVLLDYKTDAEKGRWEAAAEEHRFQIETYGAAIGRILGRPVKEGYVWFVEGGLAVRIF